MRAIISILLLFPGKLANACLILFLSNGDEVLVANHEDWFASNAAVRFISGAEDRYASIIFTFEDEGWAQGGMNEHGLFFDGALTPNPEVNYSAEATEYPGYVWQAVLDRCKSVEEAIRFLKRYKLPDLEEAHIVLADKSGHAAVVGIADGQVMIEEQDRTLVQTNFNRWHPELSESPTCDRYEKTIEMIQEKEVSRELMLEVLANTHQDSLTVYSNIYDLQRKEILVYSKRDFQRPITLTFENAQWEDCMISLAQLKEQDERTSRCITQYITVSGHVVDELGDPVPFVNIGIKQTNLGTISDPDGSFILDLPLDSVSDSLTFSSIGYAPFDLPIHQRSPDLQITLKQHAVLLDEVSIEAKKSFQRTRLGYMKGSDGLLPLDSLQGGAAVATLFSAPVDDFYLDKLQYRLLYNSKDTSRFRLHIYAFDQSCECPGQELLKEEIILEGTKRYGWERFDVADKHIFIHQPKFFIGLEWLNDRASRKEMLDGLKDWEAWKQSQFMEGNEKVDLVQAQHPNGEDWTYYKYHGNMMNWPGWAKLPPFTGLMVETGKQKKTIPYKTFERKTSFSPWVEKNVTLNLVVQVTY